MADTSLVFAILADDKTAKGMSSARKRAVATFAAIGAAAVAFGVKAAKAAMVDQESAATLAQTLKNTTGARAADVASVEDWISKTTLATGVADDQLRPALGALLRVTRDTATAQDQLSLAMDVAAATGKPLEAVSQALAKAQLGNVGALGRLGIATKNAKGDTLDFKQVYKQMTDQFGGSQAAKLATPAGKFKVMRNAMDEATESVGYGLMPIITQLATFLAEHLLPPIQSVTDWMSKNGNAAKILGGVVLVAAAAVFTLSTASRIATAVQVAWGAATSFVTGVTTAYRAAKQALVFWTYSETAATLRATAASVAARAVALAAAAATAVVTAAQWALNAALNANPISIIILTIVALVAALVILYKKNETVRRIIQAVWNGIKTAIGAVVGWFQNTAWPVIRTVIGLIGAQYRVLWTAVKVAWGGIRTAVSAVVDWFKNTAWPAIKKVADLFAGVWDTIAAAAKAAFNGIASVWNSTVGRLSFRAPDWVPGIGGKGWDVPDIPMLAAGAIVTRPTLAMIGESGPEAVVPLGRGLRGVTVESGAVQVTIHADGADGAAVRRIERAVDAAFDRLLVELRTA